MTIYKYTEPGVIDEITFRKNEKGSIRAYLHARPGTDLSVVQDILQSMNELGMEHVASTLNNRPMLELRGFKEEKDFIRLLTQKGWVKGKPYIYDEKSDRHGFMDILRKRSLQASGIAMMIADLGFTVYGIKEKNLKDTIAGLSYMTGSATLVGYGRNDQSQPQIRQMANNILDYARAKGYEIPDDSAAAVLGRRRELSPLKKVDNFFRENPSEVANSMYAVAGGLIAASALQGRILKKPSESEFPNPVVRATELRKMRKSGWGDFALGSSTVASGLLGTFVKEKAHDPDDPPKHGIKRFVEWVKERPLAIAGAGYMASTVCHIWTTVVDRQRANSTINNPLSTDEARSDARKKMKAIPWRGLFIVSTLIGEVLLAMSSKGHGEGIVSDNSVDKSTISVAAELIACQPVKHHEELIKYMGDFLGGQEVLAMKNEEVIAALREQVKALCANPWVQCHGINAGCTPEKPATQAKTAVPAWQTKLAAEAPVSSQLSV